MKSVERTLKTYGRKIVWDLRKGARPNKKTGTLDKSISWKVDGRGKNKASLKISQVFYGKYLNAHTQYMDKVFDKRIPELTSEIIDDFTKDLFSDLEKL